jgi:hypothetical protein
MIKIVRLASCQVTVIFVRFESNLYFLGRVSKNAIISNFMKIRPVGAEVFHAEIQTNGHANVTYLIVAFRNFANAPKN